MVHQRRSDHTKQDDRRSTTICPHTNPGIGGKQPYQTPANFLLFTAFSLLFQQQTTFPSFCANDHQAINMGGNKKLSIGSSSSSASSGFDFSDMFRNFKVSKCKLVPDNAPGHGVIREQQSQRDVAHVVVVVKKSRRRFQRAAYVPPVSPTRNHSSKKWVASSPCTSPTCVGDDRLLCRRRYCKASSSPHPHLESSMEAKFRINAAASSRSNAPKPIRQASVECLQQQSQNKNNTSNITLVDAGMATLRKNTAAVSSSSKKGRRSRIPKGLPTIEL